MCLWDSKERGGRPDIIQLVAAVYREWNAEVVLITSNWGGNKELMEGCKKLHIPAFVSLFLPECVCGTDFLFLWRARSGTFELMANFVVLDLPLTTTVIFIASCLSLLTIHTTAAAGQQNFASGRNTRRFYTYHKRYLYIFVKSPRHGVCRQFIYIAYNPLYPLVLWGLISASVPPSRAGRKFVHDTT